MRLHYDGEIRIKKLELGPWSTNCYIIACPQSNEGLILDAPAEAERILAEAEGVKVKYLVLTHSHPDHIGALRAVKTGLGVPLAMHPRDAGSLPLSPELNLEEGDLLTLGTVSLKVLHTPGHTPGSLCLLSGKHLFSGDTLFPGGPGKTATPADFDRIIQSLVEKIFPLPDETIVYPGHGADTVLGKEKKEFALFSQRPRDPQLCGDVLWLSP
jgi:glyoxylase-like metal-dependent hydrolase (beta-lactamase superfamily II)